MAARKIKVNYEQFGTPILTLEDSIKQGYMYDLPTETVKQGDSEGKYKQYSESKSSLNFVRLTKWLNDWINIKIQWECVQKIMSSKLHPYNTKHMRLFLFKSNTV